jgi:multidrug efflux pump subunit AcrB
MEPNNNIDKVFREGFSGLEFDPGVEGWSALEKRLAVNDRRQRMLIWRWTSLAAMLVVVFSAGYLWYHADRQMIPPGNENRLLNQALPKPGTTRKSKIWITE